MRFLVRGGVVFAKSLDDFGGACQNADEADQADCEVTRHHAPPSFLRSSYLKQLLVDVYGSRPLMSDAANFSVGMDSRLPLVTVVGNIPVTIMGVSSLELEHTRPSKSGHTSLFSVSLLLCDSMPLTILHVTVMDYSFVIEMPKTAVVTGSAQGIGRSIALRLAADGMNVTLNDLPDNLQKLRELASEITEAHSSKGAGESPSVHIHVGDVSVSADVQNMVKETVSAFGALDVVRKITRCSRRKILTKLP